MPRGRFIALEGGEGGGKTGALQVLAAHFRAAGHDPLVTREPGGTPGGQAIRPLLLASGSLDWSPMAELLLVNAARAQHVATLIRPALDAGRLVLCDRYVGSSLAYQGAGRGLAMEDILALHRIATGDLWPDLTLVLDIDPRIGLARSRRRLDQTATDEGRFEALDLDFHDRVRRSFLAQAAARAADFVVIDADQPADIVQAAVIKACQANA